MKSLYLRIYLTMVVVLLLFASLSGWMFQRQIEQERGRAQSMLSERDLRSIMKWRWNACATPAHC